MPGGSIAVAYFRSQRPLDCPTHRLDFLSASLNYLTERGRADVSTVVADAELTQLWLWVARFE
jgi:hypothetical protein